MSDITPPTLPDQPTPDINLGSAPVPAAPIAPLGSTVVPDPELANQARQQREATDRASQISAESTAPPPPGPHAKLMAMINGLMDGLGAASTSLATGGREGGAKEVAELQMQRKQQELEQQKYRDESKNQRVQQQIQLAQLHEANFNTINALQSVPDKLMAAHLGVTGAQQEQDIKGADFAAAHGGMNANEFTSTLTDEPMGGIRSKANTWFTTNASTALDAGRNALGKDDPAVQALQKELDSPSASPKGLYLATTNLMNRRAQLAGASKEKSEANQAEANSPVAKLSTPEALAAPGAQAAIDAKIADPTTSPEDVARLRLLRPQAAVAQYNAETIKAREALTQQTQEQGDPKIAGQLLANRSLTLSELKSRKVTDDFIEKATLEAQKIDPNFKAAEADAQAKNAATPSNVQFFGNTDSLLIKGGTIDQLAEAYKGIGNTKIPAINNLDNLRKAASGSGALSAVYAAQLAVADDWSKVMSGSAGSDTSREQALKMINAGLSPDSQNSTLTQLRKGVTSQRNGRIGTNPYLKDMFPDPSTRQETAGVAGTIPAVPTTVPANASHTYRDPKTHEVVGYALNGHYVALGK